MPTKTGAIFPAQGQFIVLPTHFHPSYTIQYTASIQRDLGKGWQLQLDYIGNGTRHAPIGYPIDNAVYIPGVWGAGGTGCAGIVTTGPAAVKPGAAGTNCSTTANQNSRYALTIANPTQGNQYAGGGGWQHPDRRLRDGQLQRPWSPPCSTVSLPPSACSLTGPGPSA